MIESITPYQVVVPLFCAVMVAYAWNLAMRQKKTIWEAVLWTIFWCAIGYISFFPESLQYLSALTGIKKNENAATITALGVLFFIVFYMIMRIEELEQRVTRVIREKALEEAGIQSEKIHENVKNAQ